MSLSRHFLTDLFDEPVQADASYEVIAFKTNARTGTISGKDLLRIADWIDQQETRK